MHEHLKGIIPPMTTAFDERGDIDEGAIRTQVNWMVEQGVHGLAVGGSTGEGHALDRDEFLQLIEIVTDEVAGRLPIIAGIIVDSTREAIRRGRMIRDLGVSALQVTPVHYLFRPTDDAMTDHFRALAAETGQPVIIYNVVPWTYLAPDLLCRIMTEVPDVIGVKQSAGDMKLLADLLLQAAPDRRIFTAVDALLYPSFTLGSHGAIAAILTAAPRACVDLWDAVQAGDHAGALDLHRRLLPLWNAIFDDNLPANTKYAQALQGCIAGTPRAPMPPATAEQQRKVRAALEGLDIRVSADA